MAAAGEVIIVPYADITADDLLGRCSAGIKKSNSLKGKMFTNSLKEGVDFYERKRFHHLGHDYNMHCISL